jgi:hypothetical protein
MMFPLTLVKFSSFRHVNFITSTILAELSAIRVQPKKCLVFSGTI